MELGRHDLLPRSRLLRSAARHQSQDQDRALQNLVNRCRPMDLGQNRTQDRRGQIGSRQQFGE